MYIDLTTVSNFEADAVKSTRVQHRCKKTFF